jgi:hypothetical protein
LLPKLTGIASVCTISPGEEVGTEAWSTDDLSHHFNRRTEETPATTYAEIAQRLVTIATSTIWRWLQAERIKPWRYHAWQHVRDPRFLELAKPVLRLYELAHTRRVGGVYRVEERMK